MLNKMFFIAAAFLLLVLQNAGATTTESDTIWSRTLPYSIKGCMFSLSSDSIITIAGDSGYDSLYILSASNGNKIKSFNAKPWVNGLNGFTHFNTKSWISISVDADFGGMYIYDYNKDSIVNEKFGFLGEAIAINKDDKYIYVQNNNNNFKNISIYDVKNGSIVDSISTNYGQAHSLAISPNNKYLAIGTGLLKTVNPYPNDPGFEEDRMYDKLMVLNLETKKVEKEFDGPDGTEGMIRNLKFSSDGKYLGVAKLDGTVRIYDMINMVLYRNFKLCDYSDFSGPHKIAFSNDANFIYIGIRKPKRYNTEIWSIIENSYLKTLDNCSYNDLIISKDDNILLGCSIYLTYLRPNWLTGIIEINDISKDTNNISINKSINSIFKLSNIIEIKSLKFYNNSGQMLQLKILLISIVIT